MSAEASVQDKALVEILDKLDQGVVVVERDLRISFMNHPCRTLLDINAEVVILGQSLNTLVPTLMTFRHADLLLVENFIRQCADAVDRNQSTSFFLERQQETDLKVAGHPLSDGAFAFTLIEDTHRRRPEEERLKRVFRATVMALADLTEYRDNDTGEHVLRVARLTHEIAHALYRSGHFLDVLTEQFREEIATSSILHDIGKVTTPDNILLKPGKLSPEERALIEQHAAAGGAILQRVSSLIEENRYLHLGAEIANSHHERYDGKGYPNRLAGSDIPLSGRIVAVADVFDALISQRPYKQPWSEEMAITFIRDNAGTQFDPLVVEAFLSIIEQRNSTPLMAWRDDMSVGNEAMDNDHRILIRLINQLANPDRRRDRVTLEYVLDELVIYTISHFRREEAYLRQMNYPGLARHTSIHNTLTANLHSIRRRFVSGLDEDIGEEVLTFLSTWLQNHIMIEDNSYCLYFRHEENPPDA